VEAFNALRARKCRPDAVITDYHLHGATDGLQLIAALIGEFGSMAAIVISADTQPALRAAVERAGYRLLCKPVAPARLRALLSSSLRGPDGF